jgi:hypothetical protein
MVWGFNLAKARDFSILKKVQTGSVSHPAFYSKDNGIISRG